MSSGSPNIYPPPVLYVPVRWCSLTALLVSLCTATLTGDEPEKEPVIDLDPVVVEGTRREYGSDWTGTGLTVQSLSDLSRNSQTTIGELLSWQPGVSSTHYGAAASRPIVRGMDGHRVRVMSGGLSTGDLSASSPDHAVTIDPAFIETVELHRGPAALAYGGAAIGGAVDVQMDYLPHQLQGDGFSGIAQTGYQTVDEGRFGVVKVRWEQAPFAFRVNLLKRRAEDYRIPGFARTDDYDINNRLRLPPDVRGQVGPNPEGKVPNTGYDTEAIGVGAGWLKKHHSVTFGYQRYDSTYGVPTDGHTHGNPYGTPGSNGPSPADVLQIHILQNLWNAEGESVLPLSLLDSLNWKIARTDFSQQEREGPFLANEFSQNGLEGKLESRMETGSVNLTTGLAASTNDYHNHNLTYTANQVYEDFLDTTAHQWSLYALGKYTLNNTTFRAGGRLDWQDVRRTDPNREELNRSDHSNGLSIEVSQKLAQNWTVTLNAAFTQRIPTGEELFIEAPHGGIGIFQIPNPDLRIERSRSLELVLRHESALGAVQIQGFYRRMDSFIFLETQGYEVGGLTAYAFVQKEARFYGGELAAESNWIRVGNSIWRFRAFSDWIRADNLDRDQPLPRMPPLRIGAELNTRIDNWELTSALIHSFKQTRVPQEVFGTLSYQSTSPAYTLLSLSITRQFKFMEQQWSLTLRGDNLLDREARQHTSFLKDVAPLPGRSLGLLLEMKF